MKPRDFPLLKETLLRRLRQREALIGIVGMGYVGLPLALRYAEVGYRVVGVDIDEAKVQALNSGRSYIEHISPGAIEAARKNRFQAMRDFSYASECDALIICVP